MVFSPLLGPESSNNAVVLVALVVAVSSFQGSGFKSFISLLMASRFVAFLWDLSQQFRDIYGTCRLYSTDWPAV
jgi:hypothetical protein